MSNTESFDRLEARRGGAPELDVHYGPDGPGDHELGLVGEVAGKRTLDLGTGDGRAAVTFARRGATSLAIGGDEADLARARRDAEAQGAKVEWHRGDLSELAFLRADSIDVAFSAGALGDIDDLGRLFRQVHRVLRPGGRFVFSYAHPFTSMLATRDRSVAERDRAPGTHRIGAVVTALNRAGFRVDAIVEPERVGEDPTRPELPAVVVWRARKEGA